jgi:hypothetical protein
MPVQYGGDKITFSDGSTVGNGWSGFKNRIINGQMVVDQRNAGASVTPTNSSYGLDRWRFQLTQASKFTAQQNAGSVTPPVGFVNYLGITSSSSYSVVASDYFIVRQRIEGYNVADLNWGSANAKTVTLSFWVRSSLTGTFGGSIGNDGSTRTYPFSYTISAANTWEQKSITVAGDTSGTWLTTNGIGITVDYSLGMGSDYTGTANTWSSSAYYAPTGSTSVVGTNGATFYITGVQLEKGSTATSFDYRPYGTELSLCQRYFQKTDTFWGVAGGTTFTYFYTLFPVTMRTSPSLALAGVLRITDGYSADYNQSSPSGTINSGRVSVNGITFDAGNFTGLTIARTYFAKQSSSNDILLNAEL